MEHVLLRQEGVSYHVPDVATLQRWIVERRVLPTDELDFGGGQWVKAGERTDLAPFFAIVSEVEVATRKLAAVAVASSLGFDGELDSSDDFETEIAADVDAERKTVVVDSDDHPTTVDDAPVEPAGTTSAVGDVFDLASSTSAETIPAVWDEPSSESFDDGVAPSSEAVDAPRAEPSGLMGSGEVPVEWDESVPETEEAERPGWSEESLDRDSEHFERSSLLPDGDELESAPTEVYTPSTSALWPEADPPSSPFSMPTVADETEEAPPPTVLHEAAAADAPAPSEELAWADELFRDAPLPGEPSIDEVFDQPTSVAPEPELSDEPAELVGNAEDDSSPLPPDDDGWFAVVDDNGDESFSRRSQSFTGWLFIGGAVALALGFWFLRDGGSEIATPDRITVNTAGNGANQPAEGGEPAETPKEGAEAPTEAQAEPQDGGASAADGEGTPSTAGEEAAEDAPKPEEPPKEAARPARPAKTAEAIANRGWRSIDRSRIEEAEKHFGDALKIDPNHAVATYGLGYIAQRRGDNARATDLYCRARSLAGSNRELVREVDAGLNRLKATCP